MSAYCPKCNTTLPREEASACPSCEAGPPELGWPADPHLGEEVVGGQYRILRRVGSGGFGVVYEVETVVGQLRRALKVLDERWSRNDSARERFINEALVLEQVSHPNVARCYAAGSLASGQLYLLFELIDGVQLDALLEGGDDGERRPLAPSRAVRLAKQVASGLVAAHAKGVLHRDLKPENVLVLDAGTPEERIKIIDFGIAKVIEGDSTETMNVIGTPRYMAPEQFFPGERLDVRTDLWQLGATLYIALTGDLPFHSETKDGAVGAALTRSRAAGPGPRPSAVRPELEKLPVLDLFVSRLMSLDPDDRPGSAFEVTQELARIEQVLMRKPGPTAPALIDALCARPSQTAWWALCRYLGDQGAELHELADEKLASWPDQLRPAALRWWEEVKRAEIPVLWTHARTLDLSNRGLTDDDVQRLTSNPYVVTLRRLELGGNELGPAAARALAESELLSGLEVLDLSDNRIGSAGVEALANSRHLRRLRVLRVAGNGIAGQGAQALASAGLRLRELDLSENDLRTAGVEALVRGDGLHSLARLSLRGNVLGPDGAAALALSPQFEQLRALDLTRNALGSAGAAALALSPSLGQLRELGLAQNNLGKQGVQLLLGSSRLDSIETLDLSSNGIGAAGAMVLAASALARRFRHLRLDDNELGDAGLATVIGAAHLVGLRTLGLAQNAITSAGATLLHGAALKLDVLDLARNPLGDESVEALTGAAERLGVAELGLAGTGITAGGVGSVVRGTGARVEVLDVSGNDLTGPEAQELWALPELSGLRVLRAASTGLDASGVRLLANSRPLAALEELVLDGNAVGDEGVIELATGSGLRGLERLSLRDVGVGPRGAAALAASSMVSRLGRLDLSYNRLGDAGAEALAHGPGWQRLGELLLTDNEMGLAGVAAILASPAMEVLYRLDVSRNAVSGVVDLHGLAAAQIELLESSFADVAVMGADFTARFYELLFDRYPSVKPLFAHVTMSRQQQHLLTALTAVIDNIRSPDALEPKLTAMGQRHINYGTVPTHYHAVTSTLLDALRDAVGSGWSDELHTAWSDGLGAVARVMMNAHRRRV